MSDDEVTRQQFDAAILKLLKTPPKPRPKRERSKAKPTRGKRKRQAQKSA